MMRIKLLLLFVVYVRRDMMQEEDEMIAYGIDLPDSAT